MAQLIETMYVFGEQNIQMKQLGTKENKVYKKGTGQTDLDMLKNREEFFDGEYNWVIHFEYLFF